MKHDVRIAHEALIPVWIQDGDRGGSEDCSSRAPVSSPLSGVHDRVNHGWQEESDAATTKIYA